MSADFDDGKVDFLYGWMPAEAAATSDRFEGLGGADWVLL